MLVLHYPKPAIAQTATLKTIHREKGLKLTAASPNLNTKVRDFMRNQISNDRP